MKNSFGVPAPANPTYAYVGAFVDELARAGILHAVICPGSRSTPLAFAFAAHPEIRHWMHVDERSAAFFALGIAKRLAQPVALVCTSGTAAANFLPAVVEAHQSHVPMLVLTADRPPELRDNGAPQAIDQNRLYGNYVKWFADLALPEATNAALRYIRTTADRATALAAAIPAGPIQLNFPFREPLTPGPIQDQPLPPEEQRDQAAWYGRPDHRPYIEVTNANQAAPDSQQLEQVKALLANKQRGLIVVGPQTDEKLFEPLLQLAEHLNYPILADPLSQMRWRRHPLLLSSYDAFLRSEDFITRFVPEIILRFGAMPTAKPFLLYLKRYPDCPLVIIDGQMSWEEPTQLASYLLHTDPRAFCQSLLESQEPATGQKSSWTTSWQQAEKATRQAIDQAIRAFPEAFEGRVFTELAELLPEQTTLFVGNSMPVRDLDTFFWGQDRPIRIMGNRGANGIDGVTSTALGTSAVGAEHERTVLVLGDLSFLHDLNGLLPIRLHGLNLTIVLINNDGGGIFSFLPQATHPEHFEELFGVPTGLDFSHAARLYGGAFQRIESWEQFREALPRSLNQGGLQILEITTERESNVTMHRQLWQVMEKALHEQIPELRAERP